MEIGTRNADCHALFTLLVSGHMATQAQKEDPRVLKLKEANIQLQAESKFQGVSVAEASSSFGHCISIMIHDDDFAALAACIIALVFFLACAALLNVHPFITFVSPTCHAARKPSRLLVI